MRDYEFGKVLLMCIYVNNYILGNVWNYEVDENSI